VWFAIDIAGFDSRFISGNSIFGNSVFCNFGVGNYGSADSSAAAAAKSESKIADSPATRANPFDFGFGR
jgi:hypothetical protein